MRKKIKTFLCLISLSAYLYSEDEHIFINQLILKGNISIAKNEILDILRQQPRNILYRRSSFDPRLLRLDALTLKNYYYSKGFLDVVINESFKEYKSRDKPYVDIIYDIIEGRQYYLSSIEINGNRTIPTKKINELLNLKLKKPYNPVGLNDNLYLLENEYNEIGKLYPLISILDEINDSVKIKIDIDEGADIYINDTRIERIGNIDSMVVLRELDYKSGDLYSKSKIDKTSRRIREIGIFSTANIYPEKISGSTSMVNMVIELRRYKQREWNSSGGYDPISFAEGAPELPAYSVNIEWRNRAFFNSSKQFLTKIMAGIPVEVDFVAPRLRYDVSLATNWFLGFRFPTKITGYYERFIIYEEQKYQESVDRFGMDLTQRLHLQERSYIELKSVWENFTDESEKNIQERSISLKINFDKKNDPLFTKRGYLINGLIKSAGFGGSRKYIKADMTLNAYFPLSKNSIYAMRTQIGNLWGWSYLSDDYSFEKFYLGGSTSMRGWEVLRFSENYNGEPNGEVLRFMTNIELRQKVYKSFGMTFFVDGGLLANSIPNNFIKGLKWDYGFGFTFDTPLGPVRLDYAVQADDFNKRLINFGIQSLF
ncbi:MAG: outer membrane protein assembly factor [Candidatus Neomarinimicrobiota bacterium]